MTADDETDAKPSSSPAGPPALASVLFALWLALLVWAIVVAVTGGFSLRLGPLRLSSHRALPPLLGGLLACLASLRLARPHAQEIVWSRVRSALDAVSPALAAVLTITVVAVGIGWTSRVAGGSDCYGYVSQAELWMQGKLIQDDPLAFSLANRVAPQVFAPLGYQVGPTRGSIVPLYPPGLPLLMAAAGSAFGRDAIFLVVPVCGGLLVALAYVIGRFLGDRFTGLVAASLLAANPSFVLQLIQPMSDVPAAAAWSAAIALGLWGRGGGAAVGSGLAASVAILIRPNLAPLAGAVALLVWQHPGPRRLRHVAAFAAGLVPGVAALAALNHVLYGSPLRTGYGAAGAYFELAHVVPNLGLYTRWLVEAQGPFVLLALLVPLVWRRGGPGTSAGSRTLLWAFAAFFGFLVAVYALYLVFEHWSYLRFLLPGLPVALALAATSARAGLRRLGAALRVPLLVALVAVSLAWGLRFTREQNLLALSAAEERYVTVARHVARTLPEPSAFICVLHSGSLRYYGQRETLRFDWLDPTRLEPLLERLTRRGYRSYFVLEDWEEPLFRDRFAAQSPLGALDWPPVARLDGLGIVSVYDPLDRERHLRGEAVVTQPIE